MRARLRRVARAAAIACAMWFLGPPLLVLALERIAPFPARLLDAQPASARVLARDGRPLLTAVGVDGSWREPVPLSRISPALVAATIAIEDARFRSHAGVDALSVLRAACQDARALRVVSGASTLTMQVCRMIDDGPRTLRAKVVEAARALELERIRSKDEILEAYLNLAPYGGNLRGAEAAARRYFGKHAADLSLGEAALLAGLPQSPSRLRPDRHPEAARRRRDAVLARLEATGAITPEQLAIAASEPISTRLREPPTLAPHFARLALARRAGSVGGDPSAMKTTLDLDIQRDVERVAGEAAAQRPAGLDHAIVVIEVATGAVRAYVGSAAPEDARKGEVDGAIALRSPGSALKPFIYAAAFDAGRLSPTSILRDEPIARTGWAPENFDRTFAGDVTASEALQRSLNVPAILAAERAGLSRCLGTIEAAGVRLPADALERAGLALVTGGVEVRLIDLVGGYATLARGGVRVRTRVFEDDPIVSVPALGAAACAQVSEILSSRHRSPRGIAGDAPWFMWKTGTSSGRRDAWAVGHDGRYAIGVWVGAFDGAARAELVGAETAEPLLARLFELPALRVDHDPPRPPSIDLPAERTLREAREPLRILEPADGARFIALDGPVAITPRASIAGALTWFLDGALLTPEAAKRLDLGPGAHELRCVAADGVAARARVTVK